MGIVWRLNPMSSCDLMTVRTFLYARALICKGTSSGLSLCSYGLMAPACNSCNFGDNSSFLWALSFLLIGAQRFLKEELMSPKKESYMSWSSSSYSYYIFDLFWNLGW